MTGFGRRMMGVAIICALAGCASGAAAQDQEIYDAIDCSQWTLNADGTWDTGPKAEIPGAHRRLSNLKHFDFAGFYVNGVDVSAWLKAKCADKAAHNRLWQWPW